MPTTYAHYRFGLQVAEKLPEEYRSVILAYPELFYLGVHGPDLLFYYKPVLYKRINRLGSRIHAKPGRDFFEPAGKILLKRGKNPKDLAYLYGFLCHFALDRACHGYIEQQIKATGLTHTGIEAELDRYLMTRDGFDPVTHKITGHLHPGYENARVIAPYFPSVSSRKINHAIKGQIFYLNALVTPSRLRRDIYDRAFHAIHLYDFLHGLVIALQPDPNCEETVQTLMTLYYGAMDSAVDFIEHFAETAEGTTPWNSLYQYDFDGRNNP